MSTEMVKRGWPSAAIGKWDVRTYFDLIVKQDDAATLLAFVWSRVTYGFR